MDCVGFYARLVFSLLMTKLNLNRAAFGDGSAVKVALTIAGSDCSAGAGIQADLKTFIAHGVYGLTAVSAVVVESPKEVLRVVPIGVEEMMEQVRLMLRQYPVASMKTGLLPSEAHVRAVGELALDEGVFLVVDPVAVASTGTSLTKGDMVGAYRRSLLPKASLWTPNRMEAEAFSQQTIRDRGDMEAVARKLGEEFGGAVLLKGGHLEEASASADVLVFQGDVQWFEQARVGDVGQVEHGTGCTLSAAITALLAQGKALGDAVDGAKEYVSSALQRGLVWSSPEGGDIGGMNHWKE